MLRCLPDEILYLVDLSGAAQRVYGHACAVSGHIYSRGHTPRQKQRNAEKKRDNQQYYSFHFTFTS
jgi:hypothetical protein